MSGEPKPTPVGEMESANVPPFWAEFTEDGFTLLEDVGEGDQSEMEEVGHKEGYLQGVLVDVRYNVGENDSRVYQVKTLDLDRPVLFYGKTHINRQFDNSPVEVGYEIAVKQTGGEIDVGQPNPMIEYDLRYNNPEA